jgi:rhodanese-related sulfurtransferase
MYWPIWVALMIAVILYMRLKPVKGLLFIDSMTLCAKISNAKVQILDVRDSIDFAENQISGSINIYVGRLPYVKKKELHNDQEMIIVSTSKYDIKKAARTLKKAGYPILTGFIWDLSETRNCMEQSKVLLD